MIFVERVKPEPVQAFQVTFENGDLEADRVLGAFGLSRDDDDWSLSNKDGKWSMTFRRPEEPADGRYSYGGVIISSFFSIQGIDVVVSEGDWIVTKYADTDYPSVSVMSDPSFRRLYRYKPEYGTRP